MMSDEIDVVRSSPMRCDCHRLIEPLGDELLPDHICPEAIFANIEAAIRDRLVPDQPGWPILVAGGRRVGLVLRQWVEEPPNPTLANQLAEDRTWQQTVNVLQRMLDDADASPQDLSDPFLHDQQRRRGLPYSPSTIAHLRAVLSGQREPLPVRGVLIITTAYVQVPRLPSRAVPLILFQPPHDVTITGSLELVTSAMWQVVGRVVTSHRGWLNQLDELKITPRRRRSRYALANPVAKAKAHPTAAKAHYHEDPDSLDYLAEARRGYDQLVDILRLVHSVEWDYHVSRYIKTVSARVEKRRQRAGLPTRGTRGWQVTVRQELNALASQKSP
jgi:hypothetical protein